MPEYVMRFTSEEENEETSLDQPLTGSEVINPNGWINSKGELNQEMAREVLKEVEAENKELGENTQVTFWVKNDDGTEKEIPILKSVE